MKKIFRSRDLYILIGILLIFLALKLMPKKTTAYDGNRMKKIVENPHSVRRDSDVLKVAIEEVHNALNPLYESTMESSLITKLIHKSLYFRDQEGLLKPDLADHYWLENNGKTIALVLERHKIFSKDREITAYDIEDTIKLLSDPEYDGPKSYYVDRLKGYYRYKTKGDKEDLGVEVHGKYFIKFHFNRASKDNLKILEMPILDLKDIKYDYGAIAKVKTKKFTEGSGYYRVSNMSDNTLRLENKNPNSNIIEKIDISMLPYYLAKNQYQNGEVDLIYKYKYDPRQIDDLGERDRAYSKIIMNQSEDFIKLGFNIKYGYFMDKELRKSLRDSIDLPKLLGYEQGDIIYNPIYKSCRYYLPNELDRYEQSLSDLTKQRERKVITIAIHDQIEGVSLYEDKLKKAFKSNGLDLQLFYVGDAQILEIISGNNKYDLFIASDRMINTPSFENQKVYDSSGYISTNSIYDSDNIYRLNRIAVALGLDNYEGDIHDWQRWFYDNVPYIPLKVERKMTIVNKRLDQLFINEFTGLEEYKNLKYIKNSIRP